VRTSPAEDWAERLRGEVGPSFGGDRLVRCLRLLRGDAALFDREGGHVTCREDVVDAL